MSREFFVAHGVRPYHYLCFLVEDCYMAGCSCVKRRFSTSACSSLRCTTRLCGVVHWRAWLGFIVDAHQAVDVDCEFFGIAKTVAAAVDESRLNPMPFS